MSTAAELEYDPHNDRFTRPLSCPHPGCEAPTDAVLEGSHDVALCRACERPFELVVTQAADGLEAVHTVATRRPHSAFCSRTGQLLHTRSALDWAEASGGPGRTNAQADPSGAFTGVPSRDVEWGMGLEWSQRYWGTDDRARDEETVTSLSVHRGVVIAVSIRGRVGLFSPDDGRPLLKRPLEWPGERLDETLRESAVLRPPALTSLSMCLTTERAALLRDLGPSMLSAAPPRPGPERAHVTPEGQLIGPPLTAGRGRRAVFALVDGEPRGLDEPPRRTKVRLFAPDGEELQSVAAPELVRPPVYDRSSDRLLWVDRLGHVLSLSGGSFRSKLAEPRRHIPSTMLDLAPTERPLLAVAAGAGGPGTSGGGGADVWLADGRRGDVCVWRARLGAILEDADWSWEPMFEAPGLGALRGFAVGQGSTHEANLAGRWFALATDRACAVYSHAVKSKDAEAVLAREPIAGPVLTNLGVLMQDAQGLWLRGLGPWSFEGDNPERLVPSPIAAARPGFFEQTLAVFGRQVFFASGGAICAARLSSRQRA